jgi:hypothetical protein
LQKKSIPKLLIPLKLAAVDLQKLEGDFMQAKNCLMSIWRWALMAGFALSIIACSKSDKNQGDKNQNGGVDGSGGELSYFTYDSFADWLKTEHPAYVRDVVYRLVLIRKSALDDFQFHEDLASRFFGPNLDQLVNSVAKVKFVAARGACPSSNHPAGDAAFYPDGTICLSYNAFKNFPLEVMFKKMLVMSMHEISHLRHFSEDEAVQWQLMFEGSLGKNTILAGNSDYETLHDELTTMASHTGVAFRMLLERGEDAKLYACQYLARAEEHAHRYYSVGSSLPRYLNKKAKDVVFNMAVLALSCGEMSEQEITHAIRPLLEAFATTFAAIEQFESPFCTGNICAGRRPFNPSPDYMLKLWNALGKSYTAGSPYSEPALQAACEVRDVATGRLVPLVWNDGSADIPLGNSPHRLSIGFWGLGYALEKYIVPVKLDHDGPFQLLDGDGFVATAMFWMNGVLQPDVSKKIHARVALMNGHDRSDGVNKLGLAEPDIPYFAFNPFFWGIRKEPTIERQFDIDCWLKE